MIRSMQPADLDRVAAAAREFHAASPLLRENGGGFRLDHFREIWTQLLDGGGVIFADFDESGTITGLLGGVIHRGIYGDQLIAEEFFWFVREAQRGAGVRLYRRFEQWARDRGAASIQMVHLFDSMPEKVARFYLRAGFEPIEMRYAKALTNGVSRHA
jgi:GNAT superfamily N-acetyltransferase